MNDTPFRGCKLALILASHVLVYTRDDKPGIDYPGLIDLPGGGREGGETPEDCVLRELHEEFGLSFGPERLEYRRPYEVPQKGGLAWFFAGRLQPAEPEAIRFGDEGQHWQLMPIADFLAHPQAIAHLRDRLRDYLDWAGLANFTAARADSRQNPG